MLVHGRKPDDFFNDVRANAPGAIIDVHHPRIDAEIGYFDLGQFDARSDRAARAGFSWDFDALEVMNGYQDPVRRSVDRVVDDWFSLLNHDHLVTATGNSDTPPPDVQHRRLPAQLRQACATTGPSGSTPSRSPPRSSATTRSSPPARSCSLLVNGGTIGDLVPARGRQGARRDRRCRPRPGSRSIA